MNDKLRKLIIIFLSLIIIFFGSIFIAKEFKSQNSDISKIKIIDYIPKNSDFTIISNSTNSDISKFISRNISNSDKKEINIIKDGIFSYLGFDFQKKVKDIYDGELVLSFIENKKNKKDILLIFKIKKNINIDNIFNTENHINKLNEIITLERPGKLNFISHIYQTKDNYIISSSNKELINNSLNIPNSNKIVLNDILLHNNKLSKINLITLSKNIFINNDSETKQRDHLITTFYYKDNIIKLRSFTKENDYIDINRFNNELYNINNIIYSNTLNRYRKNLDFLFNNLQKEEIFEELTQKIIHPILFTKNNDWVLSFSNESINNDIGSLESLKSYKQEKININNIFYSIYTKEYLTKQDNDIIYLNKKPIFTIVEDNNSYISNNFNELLNIKNKVKLSEINNNIDTLSTYKYIINDRLFIKNIDAAQFEKYFYFLKNLRFFTNKKFKLSFEDINIYITQKIPEKNEAIYLESNLKIF